MRSSIAGIICAFTFFCIVALDSKINNFPPFGRFLDPFHGFWQNEINDDKITSNIITTDLNNKAKVYYDSLLIPHIYAENEHDLYFLQGYITARHRLWQMEFQAMAAGGRLSEVFGKLTIDYDKKMRRLGLRNGAEKFIEETKKDKKIYGVIEAYTEGVNAYINQLNFKDYPVEYKFFNYKPEEWTPLKVGLIFKFIQYSLSGTDYDFENTNVLKQIGKKNFDLLFPDMLPHQEAIVPYDSAWAQWDVHHPKKPKNFKPLSGLRKTVGFKPDPDNGSNNWALSAEKTANGNPILCNDPHLNLSLPSIWFSNQLTTPLMNVMGMSIPGIPCIITGYNENIAWGVTSARRDDKDWYKILYSDHNHTSNYIVDGKYESFELNIEEIKVRESESIIDTIQQTIWGPIVYDHSFGAEKQRAGYALRWSAHDPSNELKSIYLMNKSQNYEQFNSALAYFSGPSLNFAFISKDKTIAMNIQGRYPNKWKEQGKFVMDGARSDMKWQGYIPQEHNIRIKNPKKGFVSSANEHPAGKDYPYYTYGQYYEFYRNRRIHQLLDSGNNFTIQDMTKMLNDNFSLFAKENLPFLLNHIDQLQFNPTEKEAFDSLRNWNYHYDKDDYSPIYFEEWVNALMEDVWDEFHNHPTKDYRMPTRETTFYLLQHDSSLYFFDELETSKIENITDIINQSFHEAVEHVEDWKRENDNEKLEWSKYKKTNIKHMGLLPGFHALEIDNGGYKGIINATKEGHGPSYRMIVEMTANGPEVYQVVPGGQSGNAGSPYYDDQIEKFEKGEMYKINFYSKDQFIGNTPEGLYKSEILKK
ncbi:penicillin acylase family protein [Flammeovirga sp. MY04]|uniref:penicillin acylase family protein n=1 Tax=Flammeovirga sp. MY04 TaxID=1191459 RepID=UPI0008063748|nr:penicillin acylase family protein [Flammeovirga sp. MY04]ANQ48642.1 penicillin acylase family protein [Flammeovirga sp. MY04]